MAQWIRTLVAVNMLLVPLLFDSARLFAAAAPITQQPLRHTLITRRPYSEFQVSEGQGGTARQEAEALFVDPFRGIDLAEVDFYDFDAIAIMIEEADDAEVELFDPAIQEAGGPLSLEGFPYAVGKVKNHILSLTGFAQALRIKIAKYESLGDDPYQLIRTLWDTEDELIDFIEIDEQNSGLLSYGFPDLD